VSKDTAWAVPEVVDELPLEVVPVMDVLVPAVVPAAEQPARPMARARAVTDREARMRFMVCSLKSVGE
jgi:hypothetical protein